MTPSGWTSRVGTLLLAAVGLFLALSLVTYTPLDIPLLSSSPQRPALNVGGAIGAWIGFLGRGGFGWASLLVPLLCCFWAWRCWQGRLAQGRGISLMLASLCLLGSLGTLFALLGPSGRAQATLGGLSGFLLARAGHYYLGTVGTMLTALCIGGLAGVVISGQTMPAAGQRLLRRLANGLTALTRRPRTPRTAAPASASGSAAAAPARLKPESPEEDGSTRESPPAPRGRIRSTVEPPLKTIPAVARRPGPDGFQLPSLGLLANPPPIGQRQLNEDLQVNARMLEETLREFGVEATVVNIDRGPAVTRYELTPAPGVKLTKIVSLADDLALVMKAASCHVVAPIPGKGRVGVDVPNSTTTVVYLKETIASREFAGHPSPIALPIGKDVSGQAIVTDLRECPHLLIAGATGSGKTVCLNSLLIGMLTRASPEQVKLLMVDPKMVELALFNDIPHLVAPVVTSAKRAGAALRWAVEEMERRYQLLAESGVRNIDAYNQHVAPGSRLQAPGACPQPLPYLVIVIDELADLMMVAAQDVESAITRLAQLSRAVGIHIILATQRPSVDVITGVIKANFPARLAFQVASKVDSRTILDVNGADKLLGRGDLLFLRPGTAKPIRAQGAFVTDAEIERVTAFLKRQRAPSYDERLVEQARQPEGTLDAEKDELYAMAKQLVLNTGQASTSLLQRRLRLGYGRAARMLDLMEQEGVVGPPQGSRPREVLVSREATTEDHG